MAGLSGNSLKDVYQGLMKTTDNAAISGTLKSITDGSGNASALSISTTTVKATSLQIASPTSSSSSKALVWDDSSLAVGYRELPIFESIVTTVSGTTTPIVTITDAVGGSTSITYSAGEGIGLLHSSNTITISSTLSSFTVTEKSTTFTASIGDNQVYLVDASGGAVTVDLPATSDTDIDGRSVVIKKADNSGNAVIITPNGSDTIDGAATASITTQYATVTAVAFNTNTDWIII